MPSRANRDLRGFPQGVDRAILRGGDDGPYVAERAMLLDVAHQMFLEGFRSASGAVTTEHEDWSDYWDMNLGEFTPDGAAGGPFEDLYMAKVAPSVDRCKASIMTSCLGVDPTSHDWFRALPTDISDAMNAPQRWVDYAEAQAAALRYSCMQSDFTDVFALCLSDLLITGNMFILESLEVETTTRVKRIPNPLYALDDQSLAMAPGGPYSRIGEAIMRWSQVKQMWIIVPRITKTLDKVQKLECPKSRYLNPFNVYPEESDRNGLSKCSGAYIYDTIDVLDLVDDMIVDGEFGIRSGNYANLPEDDWGSLIRDQQIPEVRDQLNSNRLMQNNQPMTRSLGHYTRFGKFDVLEWCDKAQLDYDHPAVGMVLHDFNADPDRARHMKTWIMEEVGWNEPERMVRFQPNPYDHDRAPIPHHRLIAKPNRTLGYGIYARSELPERIHNYFIRAALTAAQRLSDPPIIVYEDRIDPAQIQELGGIAEIPPGMIIKAKAGIQSQQGDIIEPVKMPHEALEFSRQAAADTAFMIEDQTLVPSVVAGQVPGPGVGQSGVKIAAGGAEELFAFISGSVSRWLANQVLRTKSDILAQYWDEPKTVVITDDQGKPVSYEVPAEAWEREVLWFAVGQGSAGDRAAYLTAFDAYCKMLAENGRLNFDEAAKVRGRMSNIVNAAALVAPPPQPDPPARRFADSFTGDILNTPPRIAAKLINATIPAENKITEADVAMWEQWLKSQVAASAGLPPPPATVLPPQIAQAPVENQPPQQQQPDEPEMMQQ